MPVAVVDVGSNTVRLVVSRGGQPLRSERAVLRLGADVEAHGLIPPEKLALTARVVARFADLARAEGVERLEVLVTSPGRQAANGADLAATLEAAAGCPARILSAAEEGPAGVRRRHRNRIAATAAGRRGGRRRRRLGADRHRQPSHGTALHAVDRSRLTTADEPSPPRRSARRRKPSGWPARRSAATSRRSRRRRSRQRSPSAAAPAPSSGCSARSSARRSSSGRSTCSPTRRPARFRSPSGSTQRARTLLAGAIILSGFQQLLGVPLDVVRGGLRDGALAELAARRAAA